MKKIVFMAECIVIGILLILVAAMIKDESSYQAKAKGELIAEEQITEAIEEKIDEREEEAEDAPEVIEDIPYTILPESSSEGEEEELLTTKEVIERNKKTQIVVFGDSIWNAGRGEDGIAEQIMKEKDVHIYNCSIGGTSAAVYNESTDWSDWTSKSFNGMMYLVNDIIDEDELIGEDAACGVFKEIDFNEVDYIIVSYGLNDYFSDIPVYPKEYFDLTSYMGALRHGIHKIKGEYPHIEFILTSPTYCGLFEGERQYGLGTYVEAARSVSAEYETHFLDMYHALGKNPEQKSEYLEDGVHLTEEGREMYARSVIDFLTVNGIE